MTPKWKLISIFGKKISNLIRYYSNLFPKTWISKGVNMKSLWMSIPFPNLYLLIGFLLHDTNMRERASSKFVVDRFWLGPNTLLGTLTMIYESNWSKLENHGLYNFDISVINTRVYVMELYPFDRCRHYIAAMSYFVSLTTYITFWKHETLRYGGCLEPESSRLPHILWFYWALHP